MRLITIISLLCVFIFSPAYAAQHKVIVCRQNDIAWAFVIDFDNNRILQPESSKLEKIDNNHFKIILDPRDAYLIEFDFNMAKNSMMSFFVSKKDQSDKANANNYECKSV